MFKKINPSKEWIILDDNPLMKQKCEEVALPLTEKDIEIISRMTSYVDCSFNDEYKQYDIQPGIGMAAIQMGYPKKIIYIHFKENETEHKYLLCNPTIISRSFNKSFLNKGEGCLSVKKDIKGYSIRNNKIAIKAFDLFNNKKIEIEAEGLLSICLQHEIDHTNNLFFYEKINNVDPFYFEKDWIKI